MTSARLFFAVDPPCAARADLEEALGPLRALPGAPRWTDPGRWHITLLFLGAVPREVLPALAVSAAPLVAAAPPVTLRLAGAGRFGSKRRPSVAWAGVDGDVGPLTVLADALAALARDLDLPVEERPFRPHLTLGRWAPRRPADGTLTDRLAGYRGPAWPVGEVLLLESRPGPLYEVVGDWPVG
ncbi:MAG: RNA 2',3'-cyclic phosphodiesterase [Blastococcus sp.]|nr:RNA 2',3'-cyclic phosphodiesterase [Blastococcus sp.]